MADKNKPIQKVRSAPIHSDSLFGDIREMIDKARQAVAVAVNSELTLLYWSVGKRIHDEILKGKRAAYGKQIVSSLSRRLTLEYGKGWGERHLRYCLRGAEIFPDKTILHTLCAELSWTYFKVLVFINSLLGGSKRI